MTISETRRDRARYTELMTLPLAAGFVIMLFLFQRQRLRFGQNVAVFGDLGYQRFQPGFEVGQIVP